MMKTLLAFLLLATTASAGRIFEFRISELQNGVLDTTPLNPFDPIERVDITETFWADAQPFQVDILRWDFVVGDGTMLASVAPYTVSLPFLVSNGRDIDQYLTTDSSPTPWGEDIRWRYDDFLRSYDFLAHNPVPGEDRVNSFSVTKPNGIYRMSVTRTFVEIPEPATHIMLALVGLLAWCVARRGRA